VRPLVVQWLERYVSPQLAEALAPGWFACVGLAGLVSLVLMLRAARRRGIDPVAISTAVLWCYVGAVAAGILVPMLIDACEQSFTTGHVQLRWAGMTSFWGYVVGAGMVAIVCHDHRISLARVGDMAVAPLGIALALARIGCFLAGCDYGKVTSLPWAVRFPSGSPAWQDQVHAGLVPSTRATSLPVHPTQLYEALLGLAICALALVLARSRWSRKQDGRVFVAGAAAYAIGRIAIEMVRGDAGRGVYAGLSSGQIFSIAVLAAIALGATLPRRRRWVGATVLVVLLAPAIGWADGQPLPPAPAPDAGQQPVPAQPPQPVAQPAMPAASLAQPAPVGVSATSSSLFSHLSLGALVGFETPMNRRSDQVPALVGSSLSIGYGFGSLGTSAWLDFDSYGNTDATQTTILASGGGHIQVTPGVWIGARAGIGATLVHFHEAAFQDVLATTWRVEAIAEIALGRSWIAWARPFTLQTLVAEALGGPIITYDMSVGIAYRFGQRAAPPRAVAPALVPGPMPPPAPPPPAPPAPPPPTAMLGSWP
jgi:phosphatidylglycerol:prolipoprotein diacylglycerol transferase